MGDAFAEQGHGLIVIVQKAALQANARVCDPFRHVVQVVVVGENFQARGHLAPVPGQLGEVFFRALEVAFARALGEYGATSMIAGYTPGKTATISTTVYQLWQTNNDALAYRWVAVNIVISAVVLLAVNMLERRDLLRDASRARRAKA